LNIVMCDGGLSNRLNALVFALVLRRRVGGEWRISWPLNNWCGAPFQSLFACDLPHDEQPLSFYREHDTRTMLMHENQLGFPAERFVNHRAWASFDAWREAVLSASGIVYFNNLIPDWVDAGDIARALRELRLHPDIERRARAFAESARIDGSVVGVHIRKTDFGDAVDDAALYEQVKASPRRVFVCSDSAEVNERFAALPNCAVFPKTAFVEKAVPGEAWLHWNRDSEGREFPFNVNRGAEAVIEGLIDQLILSRTEPVATSRSTFLAMARHFKAAGWLQEIPVMTTPRPVTHAELFALLNLIRPWQMASDVKVRLGSDGDGGYVMPSLAKKSNAVLSIGIGNEVSFDNQMAALGARVLQFDHTIPASPSTHPQIAFHRVGWGTHDAGPFLSLRSMMRLLEMGSARHPILKFDTEGAEWDCLFEADSADLARFEVLTGEFHDFQNLVNRDYFDKAYAVFSKLALTHHCVHMHANNAGGMIMLGGIPFPRLLELTYLRKDAALFSGHSAEPIPGPLDRPNVPQLPEIYLRAF
jgi:hypothetical protein